MKKYIFILLAAMAFVACSEDEEENVKNENEIAQVAAKDMGTGIKEFFDAEMTHYSYNALPFALPDKELGEFYDVWAQVVNSQEELSALYIGNKELPSIDFSKYSLILGYAMGAHTGWSLNKIVLDNSEESLLLNVYLKGSVDGFMSLIKIPFWGLYPKLLNKPIIANVIQL